MGDQAPQALGRGASSLDIRAGNGRYSPGAEPSGDRRHVRHWSDRRPRPGPGMRAHPRRLDRLDGQHAAQLWREERWPRGRIQQQRKARGEAQPDPGGGHGQRQDGRHLPRPKERLHGAEDAGPRPEPAVPDERNCGLRVLRPGGQENPPRPCQQRRPRHVRGHEMEHARDDEERQRLPPGERRPRNSGHERGELNADER
mmetsp:Transcript_1730/g.4180  ORF Transcript_1730/g.4180 Transcript_1730/m.4180 type:complete len:200 (+) Transcript_1730:761-1360(+)